MATERFQARSRLPSRETDKPCHRRGVPGGRTVIALTRALTFLGRFVNSIARRQLDDGACGCYMAPKGRATSGPFHGRRNMRKLILSAVLTIAAVILTILPVLADSTGPGI